MCLGHVYIVLELVGSARLTFDDDLYYELCVLVTVGVKTGGSRVGGPELCV